MVRPAVVAVTDLYPKVAEASLKVVEVFLKVAEVFLKAVEPFPKVLEDKEGVGLWQDANSVEFVLGL